ncbi:unnamed protein product [Arabis nemorensis]|uniref:RRM domain-containing protein n=1 Tax=Arabis nemorensis TaxID=586526 RepID=A0A565CI89_9BRAS|nr:unnamed protein product [Arabis nemorensis]
MAALARIVGCHLKSAGLINSSASCFFTQRRGVASKLFVGGLSFCTTEQGLSEAFSQFGQVVEVQIIMDRVSDKSKGFGFVTFASDDEAQKALTELNGRQLNGRAIYVDFAKTKQSFGGGFPIARGPPEPVIVSTETETVKSDKPKRK